MDNKKALYIGAGLLVIGGGVIWLHKRGVQAAASSQDAAASDAQLAAMMLQQPLSYSSGYSSPATVSGPSVDTGNAQLQSLINSVLNPSASTAQSTASQQESTGVDQTSRVNTIQLPSSNVTPNPVMIGTYSQDGSSASQPVSVTTQPRRIITPQHLSGL